MTRTLRSNRNRIQRGGARLTRSRVTLSNRTPPPKKETKTKNKESGGATDQKKPKTKPGAPCGGHRPPPDTIRPEEERKRAKNQKKKDPGKPPVIRLTAQPAQKEKDYTQKNKKIRQTRTKSSASPRNSRIPVRHTQPIPQ
ncbi:hypothetical protein [Paracoccus sp. N5]|uniref:hypothetical protein n=1 Tax=Paracoccus sp. N5 TaxID=1101189 RepID=UPI0012F7C839|nr:hypothetical protein [Paracoccus sp. N5]